ncbi:hypothetical protein L1987_53177 [Smallanthus sonchifolius]|uniref:Uncharacterized protein n=1 Tax=Smallanthus sonchifolius TaxID=185202 RepID=A0ACB9EVI9_9ASTR|nr:hypothetical protein L1987_53177 [Smallanthus sonchifolius]
MQLVWSADSDFAKDLDHGKSTTGRNNHNNGVGDDFADKEVRNAIGDKGKVHEDDLHKLNYLKAVIKETFRLYPISLLLVPRESRDQCVLNGYEIPKKTRVYVHVWGLGRDPKRWERPEVFEPERFMGSGFDYRETGFEFIPFGSGRVGERVQGCP